jgi:hypothetical protein
MFSRWLQSVAEYQTETKKMTTLEIRRTFVSREQFALREYAARLGNDHHSGEIISLSGLSSSLPLNQAGSMQAASGPSRAARRSLISAIAFARVEKEQEADVRSRREVSCGC